VQIIRGIEYTNDQASYYWTRFETYRALGDCYGNAHRYAEYDTKTEFSKN
jgi:hypothetical protein